MNIIFITILFYRDTMRYKRDQIVTTDDSDLSDFRAVILSSVYILKKCMDYLCIGNVRTIIVNTCEHTTSFYEVCTNAPPLFHSFPLK